MLCIAAASVRAQTETAPPAPRADGVITGRVVAEDGQPLAGAVIFARSLRGKFAGANADAEGKFTLSNLERGAYIINTYLAGYYDPVFLEQERGARTYYRPGDTVTIKLGKGCVITGRVRDAQGEPLVAARVRATRVRDEQNHPLGEAGFGAGPAERTTDDRGVYRLYGLPPGVYLVWVGGKGMFNFNPRPTAYDDDAPTFYPSTTRDGATEIVLQSGQEAADIDIRYRGEAGHAVSGAIEGGVGEGAVNVLLSAAGSPLLEGFRQLSSGENATFVFDSLADGDYELVARRFDKTRDNVIAATSQRITVRGADVTGLRLTLTPLAAIVGRVVLEAAPPAAAWKEQCQTKLDASAPDAIIRAQRQRDARGDRAQPGGPRLADTAPDDKGEFALRGLTPGRFRLDLRPPGPDWYVRATTLAAAPPAGPNAKTTPRVAAPNPLADVLTLAAGAQLTGLTVTLAPGAASFRGRVAGATDGAPLPELFVYLVPVERERADDPLRYAMARVRSDGSFAFTNLAPGRYRLLARPAPAREQADDALFASFPDADTRAQLRRAAETSDAFELQPCQRLNDYVLRYAPKD